MIEEIERFTVTLCQKLHVLENGSASTLKDREVHEAASPRAFQSGAEC